jgi:hypothetical protein
VAIIEDAWWGRRPACPERDRQGACSTGNEASLVRNELEWVAAKRKTFEYRVCRSFLIFEGFSSKTVSKNQDQGKRFPAKKAFPVSSII